MGVFDDLIEEGEEILASGDCNKTKQFIKRGEMLLSDGNKSLRASLYMHRMTINGCPPYTGDEKLADVKTIVSAARMAIEQRETKLRELEASSTRLSIDEHGFAENAKSALDIADKAAGLVPKVAAAIGGLSGMFG